LRDALRALLPLAVLVALPLLGGRAQAGYVCPQIDSLTGGDVSSGLGETGSAADGFGPADGSQDGHGTVLPQAPAGLPPYAFRPGASSTGGCSSPSDGPGTGGSGSHLALASPPATDTPDLVDVLFLEAGLRRPPPFASRLFRPPRPFQTLVC
jgi:hypothetical protein